MKKEYVSPMSLDWDAQEKQGIEAAIAAHPIGSGQCAALARRVHAIAEPRDPKTHGLQVRPRRPARFIVPKSPAAPRWFSHTLVATRAHAVDALTNAAGCLTTDYIETHWEYPDQLIIEKVDVFTVDPNIQNQDA